MWLDESSDGCVYDTIDCHHSCHGCEYGIMECPKCGDAIYWGENVCDCKPIPKMKHIPKMKQMELKVK